MQYASIRFHNYRNNRLFSPGSWDDNGAFYLPFEKIRMLFLQQDIELNTPDLNHGREVLFELHINVQRRPPAGRGYVYEYENALVRPRNEDLHALRAYRKVFTWNTALAQRLGSGLGRYPRAVVLPYPNRITVSPVPKFMNRPLGCVMVASNKSLPLHDPRDLYRKRLEILRVFEAIAPPGFFSLYGRHWEHPPALPGKMGKLWTSLRKRIVPPAIRRPLFCWRGLIADKDALLRQAKFAICYENAADIPGYISEKIFDCLRAGCVPVYWGPREIADYVPRGCFIDARAFPDARSIVAHVLSQGEQEHARFQEAMASYLRSRNAMRFSADHFARTLVEEIAGDLRSDIYPQKNSGDSGAQSAETPGEIFCPLRTPAHRQVV